MMNTLRTIFLIAALSLLATSCGTSKKTVEQSPVDTYIMPGSEYKSGDGMIRAWGIGKSDNEATARKKARINATSEMAETISRIFESAVETYTTEITDGDISGSKSAMIEKSRMTVNEMINGAAIIYDRWGKDDKNGQYVNYIVLEIKGDDYMNRFFKKIESKELDSIDRDLLEDLFMKTIEDAGNEN